MLALQVAVWGFHSLSPQTHAPRWKRRAELRGLVPRPEAQYHASALTARRKRGSGGFCSGLDSALTFNVNDVEEAVPIDAAPNWDMPPETAIKAYDYLHSLSRLADDGREIHNAPQRYSSKHWWANLKSTWGCNILAAVGQQLFCISLWSLFVAVLYVKVPKIPSLPALPHSLLGGVIGVLLGFRTNQSYDRFWEGRKLWGKVFELCRSLSRISLAGIDADTETYETIQRHLKAFPVALKQHLRGDYNLAEFRGTLNGPELNELATADNLPLSVCTSLSIAVSEVKRMDVDLQSGNSILWWTLEDQVSKLAGVVADCERLVRTPVPLSYSVHTSRLLSLWAATLPFVLVGSFRGWLRLLTAPITAFVSYSLFCTEELGHLIEEPFGAGGQRSEVLPLGRYCEALQGDLDATNRIKQRALRSMEETRITQEEEQAAALEAEAEAEAEEAQAEVEQAEAEESQMDAFQSMIASAAAGAVADAVAEVVADVADAARAANDAAEGANGVAEAAVDVEVDGAVDASAGVHGD